ncbi:hypothetical protein, partial [Aliiroseovarius marinus]|uniref:hypothetical protein n=1 Tax=Aliiroseovarius marinus TaxID=2500159 RepID=UPI00196B33DD
GNAVNLNGKWDQSSGRLRLSLNHQMPPAISIGSVNIPYIPSIISSDGVKTAGWLKSSQYAGPLGNQHSETNLNTTPSNRKLNGEAPAIIKDMARRRL